MMPMRMILAGLLLGSVAGCGSLDRGEAGWQHVSGMAKTIIKRKSEAATPLAEPTRAELAAFKQPILEILSPNGRLFLVPVARRDGAEIWSTATRQTVLLRSGQIRATRGFGDADIIEATGPDLARLSAGGRYDRSFTKLDGADQPIRTVMACQAKPVGAETVDIKGLAYNTRKIEETCESDGEVFETVFWLDASGVRKSRQYLGDDIGYVTVSHVID
ncbi:Group 4 capsule polysaccharide lipoprotein gfcB, YjbF [Gemmobacter aquatilis]|uniref:Group 4 capsule polysaccharide lipoprotein gfcB, YjbF n=2 Tax=Gemmobacter aquatilis TaxID=933059 RepID=A0A1H7YQ16_9RHOB|nr:Group 4 capsule polysaccharide lipoprotein gfcB, YjbF [Gemmobacter aquatilis]